MRGKIVIRSSPTMPINARKSPVEESPTPGTKARRKKSSSNVGEVAGGTAANCVVVSCCCPCVLFEFLILAVYKVPANLCRRMVKKKRQKEVLKKNKNNNKKKNKRLLVEGEEEEATKEEVGESSSSVGEVYGKGGYADEVSDVDWKEVEMIKVSVDGSALELDKQMWDRFNNTGFWRSPSQRFHLHDLDHDHNNNTNTNGAPSSHDQS